jgi:hypothetical protein
MAVCAASRLLTPTNVWLVRVRQLNLGDDRLYDRLHRQSFDLDSGRISPFRTTNKNRFTAENAENAEKKEEEKKK